MYITPHFGQLKLEISNPKGHPLESKISLEATSPLYGNELKSYLDYTGFTEEQYRTREQHHEGDIYLNCIQIGQSEVIGQISRDYLDRKITAEEARDGIIQWIQNGMEGLAEKDPSTQFIELNETGQAIRKLPLTEAARAYQNIFMDALQNSTLFLKGEIGKTKSKATLSFRKLVFNMTPHQASVASSTTSHNHHKYPNATTALEA